MRIRLSLVALGVLFAAGTCFGQQYERASLGGTVVDASGAVVPNATIVATEQRTGVHFTTTTNQEGVYNFLGLPVGQYNVEAQASGFSKNVQTNVVLNPASVIRIDLQLKPGSTTTSISVVGQAPLVEVGATTWGFDIPKAEIADLPLKVSGETRNITELIGAVPGVTNQGFGNNINGSIGFTSELIVDGASATYAPSVIGVAAHGGPSVEAVAEFEVVNTISAEYGNTGGAAVVVVTKSGTNAFHGDAYEYLRNDGFDSRNFFAPTVARDKEHDFGFTLGGPIRKNKTFFFGQLDNYRQNVNSTGVLKTLPTMDERAGNFSALLGPQIGTDALGKPVFQGQIYDPSSTRTVNGALYRDPFDGNMIPPGDISLISKAYQAELPTNVSTALVNNYVTSTGLLRFREPSYFIKLDQQLGNGMLSGSYRFTGQSNNAINSDGLPLFYGGQSYSRRISSVRLSDNRPIHPNLTNVFTFGFDRSGGGSTATSAELGGVSKIGLTGSLSPCTPNAVIQGGFVAQLAVATPQSSLGDGTCGGFEADNMWKYNDNVGYFRGKHFLKFGVDYNRYSTNFRTFAGNSFGFAGAATGLPGPFLGSTGFGYASFLLGEVDNANVTSYIPKGLRNRMFGMFIQDEYRVTPRLTLNYGLRYDWQPFNTSPFNDAAQFNPSIPNPGAGNLPGALEFLGFGTGRDSKTRFADTYKKGFGPRMGVAYKLNDRTVLRASYGLFQAQVSEFDGEFLIRQGFYPSLTVSSTSGGVIPAFNWNAGVPAFNHNPDIDPTIANGQSTGMVGADGAHPPQIQIVNATVQRELPGRMLLEVQYNGTFGHHLYTDDHPTGQAVEQLNQLNYSKYGSLGQTLNLPFDSPEAGGIPSPYPGFSGTAAQALRPYPQYLGIAVQPGPIGNSIYHGGTLKLERRFSSGLAFQLGYIYSKTHSDMTSIQIAGYPPQDAYNRRANWSVSDVDITHNFLATYSYELPFGSGKRFLTQNKVLDQYLLGGWKVSGINSYSSGTPLSVSTNIALPTITTNVRPNLVAGAPPVRSGGCGGLNPATDVYLNSAAFADPAPFTFGNAPRLLSSARGCAGLNESISVLKESPVYKERVHIQLGFDFFNLFNRHIFNGFQTDIDSPGFGSVSGVSDGRRGQAHLKIIW